MGAILREKEKLGGEDDGKRGKRGAGAACEGQIWGSPRGAAMEGPPGGGLLNPGDI